MTPDLSTTRIYTDFQGFSDLRSAARDNSPAALKEVANQFEAMFVQMMLKSMRDASLSDGVFDSDQSKLYTGLFDQQIAIDIAGRHDFGIAEMLTRQLGRQNETGKENSTPVPRAGSDKNTGNGAAAGPVSGESADIHDFTNTDEFVSYMRPLAEKAAASLGTTADVLIAQAALETGWGRNMIRNAQGGNSFNLFGIKSDARWKGPDVRVASLEYVNGRAGKKVSAFRTYESYQQGFDDYVDFIKGDNRYRRALDNGGDANDYIDNLHKAGYATDPHYAEKVIDIMKRIST